MAVMIKTLSQLPVREQNGALDAANTWHEVSIRDRVGDPEEEYERLDGAKTWHEIAVRGVNLKTGDRYWSSWKTALSNEILYSIYSNTYDNTVYGLEKMIPNAGDRAKITARVTGSNMPGVLKTLELRNGLQRDIDLSVMHDELCAMVGNDVERAGNYGVGTTLNLSGDVTVIKYDTLKICSAATSANLSVEQFNNSKANVVPNARSVFNFTRDGLPVFFATNSQFKTVYYSEAGPSMTYDHQPDAIKKETVPHDAYIFRIQNSATICDRTWTAPKSGWFTCFGWLSEISTGQASNYQRWVALEGNLNSDMPVVNGVRKPNWCILQLQPFVPSPYISYVGFGVPVKKGVELRIRTGFAVGASSGNYAMSNTNTRASMSNHIPNCFVGGVFSCE